MKRCKCLCGRDANVKIYVYYQYRDVVSAKKCQFCADSWQLIDGVGVGLINTIIYNRAFNRTLDEFYK